jgi:hypothetical protein
MAEEGLSVITLLTKEETAVSLSAEAGKPLI